MQFKKKRIIKKLILKSLKFYLKIFYIYFKTKIPESSGDFQEIFYKICGHSVHIKSAICLLNIAHFTDV